MYKAYLTKKGNGVFTSVRIPKGVPVCEVTGNLYAEDKLPDPTNPAILQVGPNLFVGPSGDVDDYIRHHCDPNCLLHIVGNRAILYSLYNIPEGSEITFDYSTSSTDTTDTWKMECNCGSPKCRKTISGLHYLPAEQVKEYSNKGMIPLFLKESIFKRK